MGKILLRYNYWLKRAIQDPKVALDIINIKLRERFLWNYYYDMIRDPKTQSPLPGSPDIHEFQDHGFQASYYHINVEHYRQYLEQARYGDFPTYYAHGGYLPEKSLEHFLAAELLGLGRSDIYVDIASGNSPAPHIYSNLYGCKTYRQDLAYPDGLDEASRKIGGDAGSMPVKDSFATAMALHCSFEHFQRESDMQFMKEADRVLMNGGRLCIVPLYLHDRYGIHTNPVIAAKEKVQFEDNATLYCTRAYKMEHGRFYDIEQLDKRVRKNCSLDLEIYVVNNATEIHPSCHVRYAALFRKLASSKGL
jgi:SAM-dependent methyltransferase